MKKFAIVLAAVGALALAAPSIASAQTVVIKRGGHHHFQNRGDRTTIELFACCVRQWPTSLGVLAESLFETLGT